MLLAVCCVFPLMGQRRVTPVKPSTNRVMTVKQNDAKIAELKQRGLVIVGDTILPDTVAAKMNDTIKITRMQYPLLTSITIGANVWDPLMRVFGRGFLGRIKFVESYFSDTGVGIWLSQQYTRREKFHLSWKVCHVWQNRVRI